MTLDPAQIAVGAAAAFIIGFSKTGVPGSGILAVPLMALVFGGRLSVGATLPLLILADAFAVSYYRKHADWSHLRRLGPWVVLGLGVGTFTLWWLGHHPWPHDPLGPAIGGIVLLMLVLALLKQRLGERLAPHGPVGTRLTGTLAGFTTMVSNAAGPLMQIYFVAAEVPKLALMGTSAWYFFVFNVSKLPLLAWLTWDNPARPLLTWDTLGMNLVLAPAIVAGALLGRRMLPHIPQRLFDRVVLVLSGIAAVRLLFT